MSFLLHFLILGEGGAYAPWAHPLEIHHSIPVPSSRDEVSLLNDDAYTRNQIGNIIYIYIQLLLVFCGSTLLEIFII